MLECVSLHAGMCIGNGDDDGSGDDAFRQSRSHRWSLGPHKFLNYAYVGMLRFHRRYRNDELSGGHVIMLGPNCESAALESLLAYQNGLQIGGM
jgi:hypothetical protein